MNFIINIPLLSVFSGCGEAAGFTPNRLPGLASLLIYGIESRLYTPKSRYADSVITVIL
jgi:hypothetical protein